MKDQKNATLDKNLEPKELDIGRPVEWLVNPVRPEIVLGVTYVFNLTGDRKTVWYTPNKRRAKSFLAVNAPPQS